MAIKSVRKEYTQRSDNYRRLKSEVLYILRHGLKEQNIPIHQIEGRIKPLNSFIDKARRQESDNPFDTITDICGVRVICLFMSDIERIGRIVESKFAIYTKDDKIYTQPEEAFGYLSVHYVATLPDICRGPRYEGLENLKFEIQLRTIAMHSWATISNYLDYKSPYSIPSHLRKDFNALSALFYVADSHFELFFRSSKEAREIAHEKAKHLPEIRKEEINLDTLTAYLRSRYPRRKPLEPPAISNLIEEMRSVGYTEIQQLEVALQKSEKAFREYEKETPPFDVKRYSPVGVVRVSLSIADEKYLKYRYKFKEDEKDKTLKNWINKRMEEYRKYRNMVS